MKRLDSKAPYIFSIPNSEPSFLLSLYPVLLHPEEQVFFVMLRPLTAFYAHSLHLPSR